MLEEASYSLAGQQQSSQFYIWLDNLPLGGITVTYDASGGIASSEPFFLHFDHLGTPRVATNAGLQTVWAWNSDAFGVGAPSGSLTINLRFPGQYYDQESGLHYNYFRDYDPETGRYVESDPIGLDGGLSTYGYVGANPLAFVD